MTMKIVTSVEELSRLTADKMFEELREHAHHLDDQLSEAGVEDPAFILMLLARLSSYLTEYAVYMSAGLYLTAKNDEELARGATKAILKDCKAAAKAGLARAEMQAGTIRSMEDDITSSVAELLQRAGGKCH